MSFRGQVERIISQISILAGSAGCQSSSHSDDMCHVWALPHIYKVTIFILQRNRYTYLKVSSYNLFHNILRLFGVLPNSPFSTSETMGDYYLQIWYLRLTT